MTHSPHADPRGCFQGHAVDSCAPTLGGRTTAAAVGGVLVVAVLGGRSLSRIVSEGNE